MSSSLFFFFFAFLLHRSHCLLRPLSPAIHSFINNIQSNGLATGRVTPGWANEDTCILSSALHSIHTFLGMADHANPIRHNRKRYIQYNSSLFLNITPSTHLADKVSAGCVTPHPPIWTPKPTPPVGAAKPIGQPRIPRSGNEGLERGSCRMAFGNPLPLTTTAPIVPRL